MRGCFQQGELIRLHLKVFPAHAGVFLLFVM